VDTTGAQANGHSGDFGVGITGDGRFVVFESLATNLVPGDGNGKRDVFLRDRLLTSTARISVSSLDLEGSGDSTRPAMSADARHVAFATVAADLVTGDTNGSSDVLARDTLAGIGAFCSGDGSASACPCTSGGPGDGCANSVFPSGGRLQAMGMPSLGADTLVLVGSGMPDEAALYFQGTAQINGGLGTPFGDGLRCVGGTVVRLGTKVNVGGASRYPGTGDPSLSMQGQVGSPGSRTYQVWYRNAAAFCTSSTFNLTNGLAVVWAF
jgi:hypothetical protein